VSTVVPAARRLLPTLRSADGGVLLVVVAAWTALIASHPGPVVVPVVTDAHGLPAGGGGVAAMLPLWTLMCVAMTVPAALPAVRHVVANSLRWRRRRAVVEFVLAYLAVWVAFGLVALPVQVIVTDRGWTDLALAAATLLIAAWLIAPQRRWFLRNCHRTVPLPPRGWRATSGCARFGLLQAGACLGVCWPLMLVMALVLHRSVFWMVFLTAACVLQRHPAVTRAAGSIAMGVAALAVLFLVTA
jgi:predicted metal-binding membrane protein